MKRIRLVTVIGNRPQFIKAAAVARAIVSCRADHDERGIEEKIIHTGQHYDANMSDIFFEEMAIPEPDYHLGICNCSHGSMTGRMLEKIEHVLLKEKPDVVMVYGDTNSTLAGALAASKLRIPVAHVEAGLRSFNMNMPEEINRVLTDHISDFLFCPTEAAVNNLHREGIPHTRQNSADQPIIINVGDVMYDASLFYRQIARPTNATEQLINDLEKKYYLATVHRAENTDDPGRLCHIIEAFSIISNNVPVVFPMHPRTKKVILERGLSMNGVRALEPVGYFDMITLLENSRGVFTDSGGLQKEAYFFHKPCIILRDESEWMELVEYGFAVLAGADKNAIVGAEESIGTENRDYTRAFYGTGSAGATIIRTLLDSVQ